MVHWIFHLLSHRILSTWDPSPNSMFDQPMSTHKDYFFVIFSMHLPLIFGYTTAADKGERTTRCMLNNWKGNPAMSAQKQYVSVHKKGFDLYDHS